MSQTNNAVIQGAAETTLNEERKAVTIALTSTGKNLTGKQLAKKLDSEKVKELRKATNEAGKEFRQASKDERKKLTYHYEQLQKFGGTYISKLSAEVGRKITNEEVKALKYKHFLPFLTIREDYYNSVSGWNDTRFINCVSRYFRNEAKLMITDSIMTEVE